MEIDKEENVTTTDNQDAIKTYSGFAGMEDTASDVLNKAKNEGNYKDYYNQVMQNMAANEYARRYYQTSLQAQGLASQGAGATAMASLTNQMYNANAEALSQYRQRTQEAGDYDAGVFAQNIMNFGTEENYKQMLKDHGFMDDKGNYTEKFNSLSDAARGTILSAVGQFEGGTGEQGFRITSNNIDALKWQDGKLDKEVDLAKHLLEHGYLRTLDSKVVNLDDGMVFKLSGSDGKAVRYIKYDEKTRSYQIVGEDEYYSQGDKYICFNGKWKKDEGIGESESKSITNKFRDKNGKDPENGDTYDGKTYRNGIWYKTK